MSNVNCQLLNGMGHKVHPKVFRIGQIYTWTSKWYMSRKNYSDLLRQDFLIRKFLREKLKEASIDKIDIERTRNALTIVINSARPGLIIGRAGAGAEELKKEIQKKFFKGQKVNFNLNIQEVQNPSLSANVVLQGIVFDLEKRIPFRRVMKQAIEKIEKAGAKGVKVMIAGRLDGAEIARTESLLSGKVPLQNLRADIDYSQGEAHTTYGTIGVKVWIYKGEVFEK